MRFGDGVTVWTDIKIELMLSKRCEVLCIHRYDDVGARSSGISAVWKTSSGFVAVGVLGELSGPFVMITRGEPPAPFPTMDHKIAPVELPDELNVALDRDEADIVTLNDGGGASIQGWINRAEHIASTLAKNGAKPWHP